MAGLLFWKRKCLEVIFEGVQIEFLSEEEGEGIKAEKSTGTKSAKSGMRNLEAESVSG